MSSLWKPKYLTESQNKINQNDTNGAYRIKKINSIERLGCLDDQRVQSFCLLLNRQNFCSTIGY